MNAFSNVCVKTTGAFLTCSSHFMCLVQSSWLWKKLLFQDVLLQKDWAQSGHPFPLQIWKKPCKYNIGEDGEETTTTVNLSTFSQLTQPFTI